MENSSDSSSVIVMGIIVLAVIVGVVYFLSQSMTTAEPNSNTGITSSSSSLSVPAPY